jgi:hypothetical protein
MMDLDIVMTKNQEGRRRLNNSDPQINRGFKLMLETQLERGGLRKPNFFDLKFNKIFTLFKRKIHINFNLSLDIKK